MPLNERERLVRAARQLVSDERLTAFFRAVRGVTHVLALKLVNEHLDKAEGLDRIFYTGDEHGYVLSVRQESESSFEIAFGCQAGPDAGDGGVWQASFQGNEVLSVSGRQFWIS
jgi:hypothetical protein